MLDSLLTVAEEIDAVEPEDLGGEVETKQKQDVL